MSKQRSSPGSGPATVTPLVRVDAGPLETARALADLSHEAMILTDAEGIVLHANAPARALFSTDGGDLAGRDVRVLVPGCPGDLRREDARQRWTTRVLVASEGVLDLSVRLRPLDPPRRAILALVAERVEARDDPERQQVPELERWALAAQGSTDGFFHRADVGVDAAWWSPRVYEMLGLSPGDVPATFSTFVKRIHPDDREQFLEEREHRLLSGGGMDSELRMLHGDGRYRHFRIRAVVTRERDGRPLSLSGSLQDVTALREARDALEENQARLRDMAAAASDFFFEMDESYHVTWLSDNFTQVTGVPRELVLDRPLDERCLAEIDVAEWHRYVETLKRQAPFRDLIRRRELADGRGAYTSLSGYPVFDADGMFRGYRGSGTDVSVRMQMENARRESEERYRTIVETAHDAVLVIDARDYRVTDANGAASRLYGLDDDELLGTLAPELTADPAQARAFLDRARRTGSAPLQATVHLRPDGTRFPVEISARGVNLAGRPSVVCMVRDVSERQQTLDALASSERRFRDFAELAADYFWETDAELRLTFVSENCQLVNGVAPEEVLGRHVLEAFDERYEDDEARARHRASLEAHRAAEIEVTRVRPDERVIRVCIITKPIFDANGGFLGLRGITRDVTEAHELSARLAFQASHDALTGLVNRAEFERRLERLLESARRDGSSHALCYLDLDQFKVVNDTCGHMAGDALLERLAERLAFRVRQRDTVARLGGDEFAVLIEHCSVDQATRVASVLHQAISEFVFTWDDRQFQVGASVGLVPITPDLGGVADLLGAADSACYLAKDQGRNRIHVYAKDDAEISRRRGEMNWVSHISGALAENRFRLRAQPVLPLSPRHAGAHHCELLVVMQDRDGNEIPPSAFLPAAERYNLANRIDRWVVQHALEWLAADGDSRGRPALTGINLSAQSLGETDFLDFIRGECERHGVPASRLCFEITETAAIANLDTALRLMNELRRDGARFALDDFGKGLSSFGYLRSLPVDYIKIDAQFVRDLTIDPIDLAMVRSINEVARLMKKHTIAEGVESHDVLRLLREVGVTYAQGYAIGRPRYI